MAFGLAGALGKFAGGMGTSGIGGSDIGPGGKGSAGALEKALQKRKKKKKKEEEEERTSQLDLSGAPLGSSILAGWTLRGGRR